MPKRMEVGDASAFALMGSFHGRGQYGLPQDSAKAVELYHRAAKLGSAIAYNNIGNAYDNGKGVERDEKMASHYYELSAMGGDLNARYNLGVGEQAIMIEH